MKNKQETPSNKNYTTYFIFAFFIFIIGIILTLDIRLPKFITIPIAIIGLSGLFYVSFVKPQVSLLILTAYLPFSRLIIGKFGTEITGLNFSNILLFIVITGWVFNSLSRGLNLSSKASLSPVIVVFCLLGLLSFFRTKFNYSNFYEEGNFLAIFKSWITPILLYFIGLNMVKEKDSFKKVLFLISLVTFIIALMAIIEFIRRGDRGSIEYSRIGGVFENPNMLSAFLIYNMFFFLSFFLYYFRNFKYWLLLIPFLACCRAIMFTFSRGAYLAFGFALLAVTFFKNKTFFILFSILLLFMISNPAFLPESVQARLASTFGGNKVISTNTEDITDSSATSRILVWKGALEMIKEHPLFGVGQGMFPHLIGKYVPLGGMDAHNTYLIIAAEMGVPALLVFLTILFMLIKNSCWLLRKTEDRYFKAFALGMLGLVFGLIMANMFGSRLNFEEVSSYFWLLSGMLMRAVIMRRNKEIA